MVRPESKMRKDLNNVVSALAKRFPDLPLGGTHPRGCYGSFMFGEAFCSGSIRVRTDFLEYKNCSALIVRKYHAGIDDDVITKVLDRVIPHECLDVFAPMGYMQKASHWEYDYD